MKAKGRDEIEIWIPITQFKDYTRCGWDGDAIMVLYAAIALKRSEGGEADEINQTIENLTQKNMSHLADWLRVNSAKLYGEHRDDWKPFMIDSISDLLERGEKKEHYISATDIIEDMIKRNVSRIDPIADNNIRLFFTVKTSFPVH